MDNNGANTNGPVMQSPNLSVPSGTAGPKVFDLSSINSVNDNSGGGNFFKKKPFIIGVLSILLLVGIAGSALYVTNSRQGPGPQPKAGSGFDGSAGGTKYRYVTQTNGQGDEARVQIEVSNPGGDGKARKVEFKTQSFQCKKVAPGSNGAATICNEGSDPTTPQWGNSVTIPPGESKPSPLITRKIANGGQCGSAQVDIYIRVDGAEESGPYYGVALKSDCATHMECTNDNTCKPADGGGRDECSTDSECNTKKLVCKNVTADSTTVTPGKKIHLKASSNGGDGSGVTFKWSVDSTGVGKGTFSSTSGQEVDWTAPATLTATQTWTFTATAKDGSGATDSSKCVAAVSFTVGPQTYNHNVCTSNQACVSLPCNPTTTDCSLSTDCKTAADCTTTTYKFNTCESDSCVSKDCPDPSQPCAQDNDCDNDNDCKSTPTHKICRNEACVVIDGAGTDNCTSDSSCKSNPTHKECQNNACVTVNGSGSDSCTSDASCQPEATPPPIPESGNTVLTLGAIAAGAIAILGGIFLAF